MNKYYDYTIFNVKERWVRPTFIAWAEKWPAWETYTGKHGTKIAEIYAKINANTTNHGTKI